MATWVMYQDAATGVALARARHQAHAPPASTHPTLKAGVLESWAGGGGHLMTEDSKVATLDIYLWQFGHRGLQADLASSGVPTLGMGSVKLGLGHRDWVNKLL